MVEATKNTLLRSFMDIQQHRIVHAVSVGGAGGVHFTYDMDNGAIAQVWRGGFLDATPMWHERGDGSSRPTGSVLLFAKPALHIGLLSSTAALWKTDTIGTGFRPKGYTLDVEGRPVFKYLFYGSTVSDTIKTLESNAGISREIVIEKPIESLYVRLAVENKIEDIGNGLYLLNDKSYYLRIDEAAGATPIVRDAGNKKELIIPVQRKIKYSILF